MPSDIAESDTATRPLSIVGSLTGQRIFISGATGFLGKVLVERLLWSVPEIGKLLLLVRRGSARSAPERVLDDVLGAPIMARLRAFHGDRWQSWAAEKVEAIEGDLGADHFGLEPERYAGLCGRVDRVVSCAATVRFDERLDRALELNARGALRTLELARDAGSAPLVHVSTCFVSGTRRGEIAEEIDADGLTDPDAVLEELEAACRQARGERGSSVGTELVAAGARLASKHGFHDVYTLTKALAEKLLERYRYEVPLAVVRPAIVESAAREPIPGWIESVRVVDPLLVAYGSGRTRRLPGGADTPVELVPVDHVVHALLAALAELEPGARSVRVYQVGSRRHPITLGQLVEHARAGFAVTPLQDEAGRAIQVARARFVEPDRLERELRRRRRFAGATCRWLERLHLKSPAGRLRRSMRRLDHFLRLIDVYRPYLTHGASYLDDRTRALWNRLSPPERERFPFDVTSIDWRSYVARTHVPGLVRFALRAERGDVSTAPTTATDEELTTLAASAASEARNVFELFKRTAGASPGVVAFQTFRNGEWLRYTYQQALEATANIAATLARRYGIEPGDRVVLWSSGCPEWVLTTFALHRLGATAVPLDPQWPPEEIAEAAGFVGAKLICAAPRLGAELADGDRPVVELSAPFVPAPEVGLLPGAEAPPRSADAEALALIVFTSGTTVEPKAVPLTHGNLLANVRALVPLMRLTRERLLSVLPVHHVFEVMVGLLVPIAGASTISYVAELKPAEISWMMGATRPTVLVAVPRLLGLLHDGIQKSVASGGPALRVLFRMLFGLSRLTGGRLGHRLFGKVHRRFGGSLRRIVTGGSALEPALGRSFGLMGFEVAEGYGLTETSPVLTVNSWGQGRFGSVGRPLPGVDVELRPLATDPAGAGNASPRDAREGEVWVRGANVMGGYYENPDATAGVLRDGWLNTGDVGRFDADGYLHLTGRTKEVIVTAAGKNVYPEEVERRYRELAAVEELVVLGLPDPRGGERVGAAVVPRPGASEREIDGILDAIAERSKRIPAYQRISTVEIWRGDLPKTTTMKVQRGRLRDAILEGRGPKPAVSAPEQPIAPAESSLDATESWILETVARLTRTRPDLVRPDTRLSDLGIDSLTHVELLAELEERLGVPLDDRRTDALERVRDLFALRLAADVEAEDSRLRSLHA